ncbi:MAG: PP2C family protein-serine/threonine phosphatase, partial [Deltaproteobacteria bacterium]
ENQQREPKLRGMGTTVAAILIIEEGVLVAHVGDSRVYRLRQGQLEQLTEDHSLLNDYIKMKRLSEEEIANFPHKNVIVRALGMKDTVKVDTRLDAPQVGDVYLLCSDGLSGPVTDPEIAEIAQSTPDLKLANLRIHENQQREPKLRGMGTTVAAILIIEEGVLVAHVGDSRVYRLRQGQLEQ